MRQRGEVSNLSGSDAAACIGAFPIPPTLTGTHAEKLAAVRRFATKFAPGSKRGATKSARPRDAMMDTLRTPARDCSRRGRDQRDLQLLRPHVGGDFPG